jgi:hypothetical protein
MKNIPAKKDMSVFSVALDLYREIVRATSTEMGSLNSLLHSHAVRILEFVNTAETVATGRARARWLYYARERKARLFAIIEAARAREEMSQQQRDRLQAAMARLEKAVQLLVEPPAPDEEPLAPEEPSNDPSPVAPAIDRVMTPDEYADLARLVKRDSRQESTESGSGDETPLHSTS